MKACEPVRLRRPAQLAVGALREPQVPACVSLEEFAVLALALEPLGRVLADRLQHPVALVREAEQALLDERLQRVEVGACDLLRRLQRAAAGEDGERSEERAAPPPRGGRSSTRSSPGASAGADRRRGRPSSRSRRCGEALEDLRGRERLRAGGGELDREREVVEARAELGDLVASVRAGSARRRARRPPSEASGGTAYSTSPCTRRSSRLVTRSARLGQACSERRELGRGLDHLLQVVEEEEHLPLADVLGEAVLALRASARSSP